MDPKCKKCRREGEKLFLKGERCSSPKCPMLKRDYPPGVHGVKGRPRLTQYGIQLREKQKAKRIYGILEKQFRNYYKKAIKKKGDTSEILLQLLEMRLDNVIYRLGLASSRSQARQMISHGFFLINNKKVNIPSYQVKAKDIITINSTKEKSKLFQDLDKTLEKHEFPSWVSFDLKEMKGKILNQPKMKEIKQLFNPTLIVEYYSR